MLKHDGFRGRRGRIVRARTVDGPRGSSRETAFLAAVLTLTFSLLAAGSASADDPGSPRSKPPSRERGRSALENGHGAAIQRGRELAELRTSHSRTYAGPNGARVARVFTEAVNYRDGEGRWRPIDNSLISSARPGYAFENKANSYALALPANVTDPVAVREGEAGLTFELEGADAPASVEANTARYRNALPGVTVAYSAGGSAVKETLTLASRDTQTTFTFDVRTTGGLRARMNKQGGVDFVDPRGEMAFAFAPPFMTDDAGQSSNAVKLTLEPASGGYTATLAADGRWLDDPARKYPVVIDPTVYLDGADQDCYIVGGGSASWNFCGYENLDVGFDGYEPSRALLRFDVQRYIPRNAQVLNAELGLYVYDSWATAATKVNLHAATRAWNWCATWNTYDGTNRWTSPGGDFNSVPATSATVGPDPGFYYWYPTELVQSWVDRSTANHGLVLKAANESVTNLLSFDSTYSLYGSPPYLDVEYEPRLGELPRYEFERRQLTERLDLGVNVANGNLLVRATDVQFEDTDLDFSLERFFNGQSEYWGLIGNGWTLNKGYDIALRFHWDDSVSVDGPSGYTVPFIKRSDGSFSPPPGVDQRLVQNVDGTYTLTLIESGERLVFDADGFLVAETDPDGGRIEYRYDPYSWHLTEIVDNEGRTIRFAYDEWGYVSTITDPWGGVHRYEYDWDGNLVAHADPTGKRTDFYYDLSYNLVRVRDSDGTATKIGYDAKDRVTSITTVTDPATDTGPKTTYTYYTGSTVSTDPSGRQTTYHYAYDKSLLVQKSTAGSAPPTLTLSGTLYAQRDRTLAAETTYELRADASDASGIESIEVFVDDDADDLLEQPCSAGCGGLSHTWTLATGEYPEGEHIVRVLARDGAGEARTETFKVVVPAHVDTGPDDEDASGPYEQRKEEARRFRLAFGLDASDAVLDATLNDPSLSEAYGVPLTAAEEQYVDNGQAVQAAVGVIEDYGKTSAANSYAGRYTDYANGTLVYVGFTRDADYHLAELKKIFRYPEKLRLFPVTRTIADLKGVHERIVDDIDALAAEGVDVRAISTSVRGNVVEVGVEQPSDAAAQTLARRYGAAARLVQKAPEPLALTRKKKIRPLVAGLRIWSQRQTATTITTSDCTLAFNAYGQGKFFALTAGHCRPLNSVWTQGGYQYRVPDDRTPFGPQYVIGSIKRNTWPTARPATSEVDAAAIRISRGNAARRAVWIRSGLWKAVTRVGVPNGPGDRADTMVCHSGATTGLKKRKIICGPLTDTDATINCTNCGGRVTMRHLREMAGASLGGDSGGPVFCHWMKRKDWCGVGTRGAMALGVIWGGGGNFTYYTHIKKVQQALRVRVLTARRPRPPRADLAVGKTADAASVPAGGIITYTVTITNNGPGAANDIRVVDRLPANVTFVSASPACQRTAAGTVECEYERLRLRGSVTATITVRAPNSPGTTVTNSAEADANEIDPRRANNKATATVTVT